MTPVQLIQSIQAIRSTPHARVTRTTGTGCRTQAAATNPDASPPEKPSHQ